MANKIAGRVSKRDRFTQAQVPFPYGQVSANGGSVIKLLRPECARRRPTSVWRKASETLIPKRQKIVAIIDDDASMLSAAGALLDAHGFATLAFASAEEFLARGAAKQIDCLLLDIDLGGMSGVELRRQLKGFGSTLPIIFMTGLDDEAIERRALETGCVAFLRKPFSQHALVEAIGKAIA
jgi:CheY-like chemotaxis protein